MFARFFRGPRRASLAGVIGLTWGSYSEFNVRFIFRQVFLKARHNEITAADSALTQVANFGFETSEPVSFLFHKLFFEGDGLQPVRQ
jgi:hypothetical protein